MSEWWTRNLTRRSTSFDPHPLKKNKLFLLYLLTNPNDLGIFGDVRGEGLAQTILKEVQKWQSSSFSSTPRMETASSLTPRADSLLKSISRLKRLLVHGQQRMEDRFFPLNTSKRRLKMNFTAEEKNIIKELIAGKASSLQNILDALDGSMDFASVNKKNKIRNRRDICQSILSKMEA